MKKSDLKEKAGISSASLMKAKGTAMPGLSSITLHQMIIPLPPLAEQKRIVAKLEEILPLCERLK